jgi:hypothetical protein
LDIKQLTTARNLAEAYVRSTRAVDKSDPNYKVEIGVPESLRKTSKMSPEETTALQKKWAEDDKYLAEFREQFKQATGIDPQGGPVNLNYTPMTKEEGEAYVQGVLDDMVKVDAWHQQHLAEYAKYKAEVLAKSQQASQISTSA